MERGVTELVTPWWDTPPYNSYGVVFVETRSHTVLAWLVNDTLQKIPPTWGIRIAHTTQNADFVAALVARLPSGRVGALLLDRGVLDIGVGSKKANGAMFSAAFYAALPFPKFLLMQTDSVICNTGDRSLDILRRVAAYDYAGSPWRAGTSMLHGAGGFGGNGGFSWRSVAESTSVLRAKPPRPHENEDGYFSIKLGKRGRAAPRALSCEFAFEQVRCAGEGVVPFGTHKSWIYLDAEAQAGCPGATELMNLVGARVRTAEEAAEAATSRLVGGRRGGGVSRRRP